MRLSSFIRSRRASIAVEFALVAPVLLLLVFGLIGFGVVLATASGLQQLAAESARASVGGLTDSERTQIVQNFVSSHVGAYPFIDARQLTVATAPLTAPAAFQVSLGYDLRGGIADLVAGFVPALPVRLQRSSIVLVSSAL